MQMRTQLLQARSRKLMLSVDPGQTSGWEERKGGENE